MPANEVPFLKPGDAISVAFPKSMQFSQSPRWHLVIANMYQDSIQSPPTFQIADADLSRSRAGNTWTVTYDGSAMPIFFLVPENGNRYGHGIPQARSVIGTLENRESLMHAALFSANAKAKASTLDEFLKSLSSVSGGQYSDGRARVTSATKSLFGYDLSQTSCFTSDVPSSDQYACAAQAVATSYQTPTAVNMTSALGNQLSVNAATYGMLIGAIYQLVAKRRVDASYQFVPGAFNPQASNSEVYSQHGLQYDPSASKPSSVVYFQVGSEGVDASDPAFGAAPSLPVCLSGSTFNATIPFSGLPVYFRSHQVTFSTSSGSFSVPATYDPVKGYTAKLSSTQLMQVKDGGSATVGSVWGFDTFTSTPLDVVMPHAVTWAFDAKTTQNFVQGEKKVQLGFADGGGGVGSCVDSVDIRDGLGHPLPVVSLQRSKDEVYATVDASNAKGDIGSAALIENGIVASKPVSFTIRPAMPTITKATAFLPKGVLVLTGSNLKYIDKITLEKTGIVFSNGVPDPNDDSTWDFTASGTATYNAAWPHETMEISYTLAKPDTRADAAEVNVEYAPASP
ncbi:MAG: hypothetical protein ACXWNK_18060 [Vulcanimicrobiaceae bacterium]